MLDFSRTLPGLDGKPLFEPAIGDDGKPVIEDGKLKKNVYHLGYVSANALLTPDLDPIRGTPQQTAGAEYVKRLRLAERVLDGPKDVDLSAEEIVLIKTKIAEAYRHAPIVIARALSMLDPVSTP